MIVFYIDCQEFIVTVPPMLVRSEEVMFSEIVDTN